MNALTTIPSNQEVYRASTDAAGLCRDIVMKTAQKIQGRQYVKVEGWQAIAIAHGCAASADEVQRVNDEGMSGFRAVGIVRRMSDGAEIARAEGFLGDDEKVWASRPVYARRAMVQTRAISRACRSAFAHVVVLIDANLSTTPAEEVPEGGFDDRPMRDITPPNRGSQRQAQQAEADPFADEPRDEPRRSTAVVAATAAITMCMTSADCRAWKKSNAHLFGPDSPLDGADQDEIIRCLNQRVEAVREPAHA